MTTSRMMLGTLLTAGAALLGAPSQQALARESIAQFDTARILAEAASAIQWLTYGRTCDGQLIKVGHQLYAQNSMVCRGPMVQGQGVLPDLRWSGTTTDKGAWQAVIIEGPLRPDGTVSLADNLTPDEAEAVRAYALEQAWMAVANGDATAPSP